MIPNLTLKSMRNRKVTTALTVLSIALSVMLLLGVERMRDQARESFAAAVSGVDLIVGARGNPVHLLLYSVFHIGNATNNLSWDSYRQLAARPGVAWSLPLSMGDSHRGYRVVGTLPEFFQHFRYASGQRLRWSAGKPFDTSEQAVLGAEAAQRLGYGLGSELILAHGAGDVSFIKHDEHPFAVVGILAATGTPIDRAIYVGLAGMHALHAELGNASAGQRIEHDPLSRAADAPPHLEGSAVTAVLIGLSSRAAALGLQRHINEFKPEPLTAILPGPTLLEVWGIVGVVERTLFVVSAMVLAVGLVGMLVALLTSLNERRREMAILRSVGASPRQIFLMILGEGFLLTLAGIILGLILLSLAQALAQDWLQTHFGLFMPVRWPTPQELGLLAAIAVAGTLIGLLPACFSYRRSLVDGLMPRV